MSLFKKPNRKFRQRITHSDSDDEGNHGDSKDKKKEIKAIPAFEIKEKPVANTITFNIGPKEKSPKKADESEQGLSVIPTKLLSFDDEEDGGEVFKLKKSNYSRRLAKKLEKERKKRLELQSVEYKTEFEDDTKPESTRSKDVWAVASGVDVEDMDVDNDDNEDTKNEPKENPFKDVLQSGIIPDAATIYAMKKHRQKAREMRDVIPLEDNVESIDENKSRLIREDDNDRSDDDDDSPSRLCFTVNTGAVERQKVREAFLSLQENSREDLENEEAAELEKWEREQIRKGVSVAQVIPAPHIPESLYYPYMASEKNEQPSYTNVLSNTTSQKLFYPSQDTLSSGLTTMSIKARLEERLNSLKQLYESHQDEFEACQKQIIEANDVLDKLTIEEPEIVNNYALFQQMRGYAKDLVECLDLKVAHVDVLTTKMMELYKMRAKQLVLRRQQDIRDMAEENAFPSKTSKGANAENGYPDENKLRRAAEREGRRMRRRKRRESFLIASKHHEGMSSDDEEADIEVIHFSDKKESILIEAKEVFEDVVEEFGSLSGVSSNFEKWKNEHPDSYNDAFVSLCLPKIFGPYVRLEMLGWNPLEDNTNIENIRWYSTLTFFGLNDTVDTSDSNDDPDLALLPSIIEKVLFPKVTAFVQDVWDPLSSQQTRKLVKLIKKFTVIYPTITDKSKQVQALLKAVCARIAVSLDDDVFVPMYPKELLENRSIGPYIFFQRQFWSAVKLLMNILSWDGILAEEPLKDMALSSLLNRYIMMGLLSSINMRDTIEKIKSIVSCFPKSWFTDGPNSRSQPKLKQLATFFVRYAQTINSQTKKGKSDEDEIREMVKDLIQMLITMHSLDEAVALAKEFNVKGFKKEK